MAFLERFRYERGKLDERASVARGLDLLFNGKAGFASFIPELGVGDYLGSSGTNAMVDKLTDEILQNVLRFEPRLREPKVVLLGRDGHDWVRFKLSAVLGAQRAEFQVMVHALFGQVRVEAI